AETQRRTRCVILPPLSGRLTIMKPALLLVVIGISVSQLQAWQQSTRDSRYPARWFAPVSEAGKPDWEILPQEAGPGEVILSKRNELGLLYNFADTYLNFR